MTLFDYLKRHNSHHPNHVAIKSSTMQLSFKALYNIVAFNQEQLKALKGKKIILKIEDQFQYIVTLLVLFSLEAWIIPVATDMKEQELEKIKSLIEDSILIDDQSNPLCIKQGNGILKKVNEAQTGIYHMTSGSTGVPKFCIRTLENLTFEGESYALTLKLSEKDKILNLPTLSHSYALGAACISGIVSGATVFTLNDFIPRKVLTIIEQEKPTIMILVPFMAKMLAKSNLSKNKNLSSLRIVLAGAGKITEEIYQVFWERFDLHLMSNYGSTETGGIVTRLTPTPMGSVGKPMGGVEIRLKDENGTVVTSGDEGEIWVRTPAMASGYLNDVPLFIDDEGFYGMNDIGFQDQDGYLYLTKRKKNVINIAGKKVNPLEIEDVLLKHPKIKDCIVLGLKTANSTERVAAIISTHQEVTEKEIRKYCHSELSNSKVPSLITLVSHIPRNKLGKVSHTLIQEQIDE